MKTTEAPGYLLGSRRPRRHFCFTILLCFVARRNFSASMKFKLYSTNSPQREKNHFPMATNKPTEAELEILTALWEQQPCEVKAIHAAVERVRAVGYSTTLKNVQRMLDKGLLTREPGPGKGYLYRAAESPATTKSKLFDRMVQTVFGNSLNDVVLHALGKTDADPDEIAEIKAIIEKLDKNAQ